MLISVALVILEFLKLGDDHRSATVGRKPKVLCALLIASGAASAPMLKALMAIEGDPKIESPAQRSPQFSLICASKPPAKRFK